MILLPLHYCGVFIGTAKVDDHFSSLERFHWHCTIPKKVLSMSTRKDIIAAVLTEDLSMRRRVSPIAFVHRGRPTRLVHVVLRPNLLDPTADLPFIRLSLGRIVFENSDHTDCRLSNLREIPKSRLLPATTDV